MSLLYNLHTEIQHLQDERRVMRLHGFFKTGEGEYGYGDVFVGLTVPQSRQLAKKYQELPLPDIETLLTSTIHEERLIALFLLIKKFQAGDEGVRKQIYDVYLSHTKYINNWDLVDSSAAYIVGEYLMDKPKEVLYQLAQSESIWERRIAILATFAFIKNGRYEETLTIAEILLHDEHDLIHKAVGWMLREVGKRCSEAAEEEFVRKHCQTMPRTMLRYAIERFPKAKREVYLVGRV